MIQSNVFVHAGSRRLADSNCCINPQRSYTYVIHSGPCEWCEEEAESLHSTRFGLLCDECLPQERLEADAPPARPEQRPGWIYFIQAGGPHGPVKVGLAQNPVGRMAFFQTGNHLDLRLVGKIRGDLRLEQDIHRRNQQHHIRGEWFTYRVLDDLRHHVPVPSTGGVTTATSGPVIQALEASMRYLTAALVAALTLALTPVAGGSTMSVTEKKQQLRRYYKANGVVRWIGAHARTTEYHPDPRVKRRWKNAARFWVQVREDAWRELHPAPAVRSVPQIICAVFGPDCGKALSVAACESHYYVAATNGQYFGVFQMGSGERARFGGSSLDPWDQVRAAYRYFSIAGWGPWECA